MFLVSFLPLWERWERLSWNSFPFCQTIVSSKIIMDDSKKSKGDKKRKAMDTELVDVLIVETPVSPQEDKKSLKKKKRSPGSQQKKSLGFLSESIQPRAMESGAIGRFLGTDSSDGNNADENMWAEIAAYGVKNGRARLFVLFNANYIKVDGDKILFPRVRIMFDWSLMCRLCSTLAADHLCFQFPTTTLRPFSSHFLDPNTLG